MFNFKNIENLKRIYSTLSDDIMKDLLNPILKRAVKYDRAVGFFSSEWLKEVSEGLAIFAQRGGKARIVTSVILSERDWNAIKNGLLTEEEILKLINEEVSKTIESLKNSIEVNTLATLSWMISQDILEFKFAIPIGKLNGGVFHTKSSLFYDEKGNGIAVFGSQNDSHQATLNDETLCVWKNWSTGSEYFADLEAEFNKKWNGCDETLKTYNITEAARLQIINAGKDYTCPFIRQNRDFENDLEEQVNKKIILRDYQQRAITEWEKNNYQGLFEMATGSGKTITSISAAKHLFKTKKRLCVVVLAPYIHLVDQWADELENFGFNPILCFKDSKTWQIKAYSELNKYKSKLIDKMCIVATHTTSSLKKFQDFIKTIDSDWLY